MRGGTHSGQCAGGQEALGGQKAQATKKRSAANALWPRYPVANALGGQMRSAAKKAYSIMLYLTSDFIDDRLSLYIRRISNTVHGYDNNFLLFL
jgi:hypothetical protein